VAARVVALTLKDPPGETTHWTADMMAKSVRISASAVRHIWKAHGLQPNRWRQFERSSSGARHHIASRAAATARPVGEA